MKYFTDEIEYPNPTEDILPLGVMWEYISSTFLNGWINYVDILSAKLILRYSDDPSDPNRLRQTIQNVENFNQDPQFHIDLSNLGDDVLILAKRKNTEDPDPQYWFFWFDLDVSDCCIGRFETWDTPQTVKKEFDRYVKEICEESDIQDPLNLDPRKFRGWISF